MTTPAPAPRPRRTTPARSRARLYAAALFVARFAAALALVQPSLAVSDDDEPSDAALSRVRLSAELCLAHGDCASLQATLRPAPWQ